MFIPGTSGWLPTYDDMEEDGEVSVTFTLNEEVGTFSDISFTVTGVSLILAYVRVRGNNDDFLVKEVSG